MAYVTAFDKHWNLALEDVDEQWIRKKKRKLLPTIKLTRTPTKSKIHHNYPIPEIEIVASDGKTETCRRHVKQLLVRGEQVALIALERQ